MGTKERTEFTPRGMHDRECVESNQKNTWHDRHGYKCHFVDEVSDGDQTLIVYKFWRKNKQRWQYVIEHKWILEMFDWKSDSQ